MPRRIKGPDGIVRIVPDDATDAEIASILATAAGPAPRAEAEPDRAEAEPGSLVDRALGLLPMAGGMAGGFAGGIGGTAFGLGVGGVPGAIGGATLGGALGESLRQLASRARGQETPTSSLEAATDIAKEAGIQGGAEALGGAVTRGLTRGARAVYRGYLKPSLAAKQLGKAQTIVDTAIREGIPLTKGGEAKAQRLIASLNQEVQQELANTPGTVDLAKIADRVRGFAKRVYDKPGADPSDYQAALSVADRIDRHSSLGLPPGTMPTRLDVSLPRGQAVKQTLQSAARSSYGVPGASAKASAEKEGARAARVALEQATGGPAGRVATLNARESRLLDAAREVRKAVEREANQQPLYGAKTLMSLGVGGGAYALGSDHPKTALAAGALTRAALSPRSATTAAILADRLARTLGIGVASAARLAAYVMAETPEQ